MTTLSLTIYLLMWPVLVGIVLVVVSKAFISEWRLARREGRPLI